MILDPASYQSSPSLDPFSTFAVSLPDQRSLLRKSYDWGCTILSVFSKPFKDCFRHRPIVLLEKNDPRSQNLYVFIHGLNTSPIRWGEYIQHLEATQPDANYISYEVPHKGNCSLKEASRPLIIKLQDYIQTHPHTTTICLIGLSNGSRVAAKVERGLEALPIRVRTVCISGTHLGTYVMSLINKLRLSNLFGFHPKVIRDLQYRSDHSLRQLQKWQASILKAKGERNHAFYVSSSDDKILPFASGLVRLTDQDHYFVFHGYTHSNLANSICQQILSDCQQWINQK